VTSSPPPRVCVIGAAGRMGRRIVAAAVEGGCLVGAAVERAGAAELGQDAGALAGGAPLGVTVESDLGAALKRCDVAIDFTHASAARANVDAAAKAGVALVLGTTGLEDAAKKSLAAAAKRIAIVHAANFSVGVNVLLETVAQLAKRLPDHDAEIVEVHHRKKTDAPSGTAQRLAEALAEARGVALAKAEVTGRAGQVGARSAKEIGVLAVRGGDVVGDHTVHFLGLGERIEVTHRATSRDTFAAGAVRAARWVTGRKPGLYDMRAVLGLDA